MKKFNLAALPLAVAGVLASTSALAGTEACFEVYKGADAFPVAAFATTYAPASCQVEAARVNPADGANLAATFESKIAYELTDLLTLDFDAIDAVDQDLHVVYIPTTDIPSGTLISMTIAGAVFDGNSDIIHLIQEDGLGGGLGAFVPVASTDGSVDGQSTIKFLTKAGVTITAGTRLVLSRVSAGANFAAIDPVGIKIDNSGCTDPTSSSAVTIRAISAKTDGGTGYDILGGVSKYDQAVADISPQFVTFSGSASVASEVNAESTDSNGGAITARTEFVYDAAAGTDKLIRNATQVFSKAGFVNRGPILDRAVVLDADDHVMTTFNTSAATGATVMAGIYNELTAANAAPYGDQIAVETGTLFGTFNGATYATEASGVDGLFTEVAVDAETVPVAYAGSDYNEVWYTVENTNVAGVMNFNYKHTPEYQLVFNDVAQLDHCVKSKELHDIGVNGAVLKVPYTYETSSNWVRITNEHTENAEITLDIFDESGNEYYSLPVGSVGEHASVVLKADKLIADARTAGYTGTGERHTMTFTVTAPRDTVHGVSVQAIPGGVDRVMPVLDKNDWRQ